MGNDIEIRVRVDNQTRAGVASVRQTVLNGLRGAATSVPVTIDNQTAAGLTRVQAQIRQLRAQSPIRLAVRFDDQSGQVAGTSRAMRGLHTAAQNASNSLTALTARSLAAAVALQRLAAAAEDAKRELNELRSAASRAATAVGRLGDRADDTEDRLSRLTGQTATLTIQMGDLGSASRDTGDDLRNLRGDLGRLTISAGNASNAFGGGGGGMGLRGQLVGAAAAMGTSLLPTLGALAPMLAGVGSVAGVAALAFSGLDKPTKFLSKSQKEFLVALKPVSAEFGKLRKSAQDAILPKLTKNFDDIADTVKELNPVVKIAGDTFGDLAGKMARGISSKDFMGPFTENVRMGTKWLEEFAGSFGTFSKSFLDFGTKSQPALDAWDNLLGGLLDTGLPGMFKEMERGIGGSSDILNGLAYVINDSLLPSLGKIAGSFADAFGPLIEELLTGAGDQLNTLADLFAKVMTKLEPLANVAADGVRALNEVFKIGASVAGDFAREVGGALLESLLEVAGVDTSGLDDGFRGLSNWVKDNQAQIRAAFLGIAQAITSMVTMGIQSLPVLHGAFQTVSEGILLAIDGIVSGLAHAFGDLPIVGDKFKDWNSKFDEFSSNFRSGMDDVGGKINEFVDQAVPRLNRAQLKLNVEQAEASLEHIKGQLKDPALTEERKAKLKVDKQQAEAALADAKQRLKDFDGRTATGKIKGDPSNYHRAMGAVNRSRVKDKTGKVKANTSFFQRAVAAINGSVVGNAFINVHYAYKGGKRSDGASFMGPSGRYAEGGPITGGSGTKDDVPILAMGGEFMVNKRSTQKYRSLLEAINEDRLPRFAKGGKVSKRAKAEAEARRGAMGDLTISHFGQMAGYRTSEIIGQLGRADSLSDLVNSLNKWRGIIKAATHGATERGLLKALDSAGRKLLGWEKQLAKVEKSLEKAKDKLDSLKSAASQLSDSVKGGILNSANITRNASGGPVTVASVMGGLTQSRDKATAFSKALADLKKKGLSSALLQQIAEAGIEGGGLETASALLKASGSEIKSLNSLQSQIGKAAGSAGKTTADAVFGAQIKAQQAYVSMLTKSQDRLEKSMEKLAKSIEKSIERAFGKKAAGGIVGAAASGGIRSNLTWVGEHGPELVNLAPGTRVWSNPDSRRMQQQAWASMLNQPHMRHTQGRAAVVGPAGVVRQPVELLIRSGGSKMDDLLVEILRKAVAARGGSAQRVLGQGAG